MSDDRPKSAVELAMERLRQKDADSGVAEKTPTEQQKADLAEARSLHASKIAEAQILHRSKLMRMADPEARSQVEAEYHRDLQRLNDDLDRKIRSIRARSD